MAEYANGKRRAKTIVRASMPMADSVAEDLTTQDSPTRWESSNEVHPIRLAAAIATPSKWRDGFITAAADGLLEITDWAGDARIWATSLEVDRQIIGTPVAVHAVYDVLAVNDQYVSVTAA